MKTYRITMGSVTGEYQADCEADALDLFAQDAGYACWGVACGWNLASDENVEVVEVA